MKKLPYNTPEEWHAIRAKQVQEAEEEVRCAESDLEMAEVALEDAKEELNKAREACEEEHPCRCERTLEMAL